MNQPYQIKYHLYKRGKYYWVKWYQNGRARYKSTKMTNKELAYEEAENIVVESLRDKGALVTDIYLSELIDKYNDYLREQVRMKVIAKNTYVYYNTFLNHFTRELGQFKVSQITVADIELYLKRRREKDNISVSTIRGELLTWDRLFKYAFKLKDTSTFKLDKFRKELANDDNWQNYFKLITYRPFDVRQIYYSKWVVERPIYNTMRHMLEENIGILYTRPQSPNYEFSTLLSKNLIDQCVVGNKSAGAGISYIAPLYIYPDKGKNNPKRSSSIMMVFEPQAKYSKRIPNIDDNIFKMLTKNYRKKPTPEDIIYYIYGVFYSNIYRETYAEFLKIDFPRAPFTTNYGLFKEVGKFGKKLADLHLLKSKALDPPVTRYQGSSDNDRIDKITYKEYEQRIYINKEKYFEGIESQVWNYHIGGYQVAHKYLKDRKGRNMDDAPRYCRIVTALSKTIEIQKQIDKIYPEIEKKLIDF